LIFIDKSKFVDTFYQRILKFKLSIDIFVSNE